MSARPLKVSRLSLEKYISSMKEMCTGELGLDKKRVLESGENSELKRLIGQINWVPTQESSWHLIWKLHVRRTSSQGHSSRYTSSKQGSKEN